MDQVEFELPKYKCHKEVWAAKITGITPYEGDTNGLILGEVGGRYVVTDEWIKRFKPEKGGYLVIYKGGYTSFSPAQAFEDGYEKM